VPGGPVAPYVSSAFFGTESFISEASRVTNSTARKRSCLSILSQTYRSARTSHLIELPKEMGAVNPLRHSKESEAARAPTNATGTSVRCTRTEDLTGSCCRFVAHSQASSAASSVMLR
jgi:hypothetical protein